MEEQRRKRAPGVQVHISAIKDTNGQISTLAERIAEYKQKIDSEVRRINEKSENARIRSEIRSLDDEIRTLKIKKTAHFDEKNKILPEFNSLRDEISTEKRRINFGSLDELEKKEKEINYKLMTSKVTSHQEREISSTLLDIKKKRIELQSLGTREKRLIFLNKRLGELNSDIKTFNDGISGKRKEIDTLKAELLKLSEKGKDKNDIIVQYEKKVEELKKTKAELYEKRKAEQSEISKKEEAYEKYLQAFAELQEQENKKKLLLARIKKLDENRNALLNEQANFDPKKFDEIGESLKKVVDSRELSLPIALVQRLSSIGVSLPRSVEDIEKMIESLKEMKVEFREASCEKIRKIGDKISELDAKIGEERKLLDSMPQTDIKLRKEPIY